MKSTLAILLALMTVVACSSEGDPGEGCDRPGGTIDVCAPGTVCGRPADGAVALVCIPLCSADDQCPKGYRCKGVDGTNLKGCRFKG